MSTVDPLEAALGGRTPEPSGTGDGGNSDGAASTDHPVLTRFGGDVQKALDAYQALDREYGQQGNRLGKQVADLEQQLASIQGQIAPPEPQNGNGNGNGLPDMDIDQLQQWFDENPAQATAYLVAQGNQMLLEQINTTIDQRLKPVEVNVGRSTATALVDGLKKALGDDVVARNAGVLVELQKTDPDFFKGDPQLIFQRMKTVVLAADLESGQRGASNGAATQDVAVLGGSSGRNPAEVGGGAEDPAAEFMAAMADTGAGFDIFGNPKRAR